MRTFKLVLEYDGSKYSGWQAQINARTVQGELQRVSDALFDMETDVQGSGRTDAGVHAIGLGMWMGLIMAFNVWFIIWPNQKKVLGIVEAAADAKAAAGKLAGQASRINTLLSIPMLFCMVAQQNGGL